MSKVMNEIIAQIDKLHSSLGRPPTATELREARKGGSFTTLNAALKLWRSKHRAKALPEYLVAAAVDLHESSLQELANQTKAVEDEAAARIAEIEAATREADKEAKLKAKADRAAIKELEKRLSETEKQLRQAESRYQKEEKTAAALQARVEDRSRQISELQGELKRAQDKSTKQFSKAMELLQNPNLLGVPLLAAIRNSSPYADQNLSAIDRGELPFMVSLLDGKTYAVQGGPGGQYKIEDLDIYARTPTGKLVCLSQNPDPWKCPEDLGRFTPEHPERFEVFRQRGLS